MMSEEARKAVAEFAATYCRPGDREQAEKELLEIVEAEREKAWNEAKDDSEEEAALA